MRLAKKGIETSIKLKLTNGTYSRLSVSLLDDDLDFITLTVNEEKTLGLFGDDCGDFIELTEMFLKSVKSLRKQLHITKNSQKENIVPWEDEKKQITWYLEREDSRIDLIAVVSDNDIESIIIKSESEDFNIQYTFEESLDFISILKELKKGKTFTYHPPEEIPLSTIEELNDTTDNVVNSVVNIKDEITSLLDDLVEPEESLTHKNLSINEESVEEEGEPLEDSIAGFFQSAKPEESDIDPLLNTEELRELFKTESINESESISEPDDEIVVSTSVNPIVPESSIESESLGQASSFMESIDELNGMDFKSEESTDINSAETEGFSDFRVMEAAKKFEALLNAFNDDLETELVDTVDSDKNESQRIPIELNDEIIEEKPDEDVASDYDIAAFFKPSSESVSEDETEKEEDPFAFSLNILKEKLAKKENNFNEDSL